jgi:hypothetical protein
MYKFNDISQFRETLRNVQHKAQFVKLDDNGDTIMNRLAVCPKLICESTPKIHGSNLSIVIKGDVVECQSRNNLISIDNDCYGFARFISNLPTDVILEFKKLFGDNVAIFGEFAGLGIQQNVAVSQLEKFWSIFRVEDINTGNWIDLSNVEFAPFNQYRIYCVRQFGVETLEIDWEHPAEAINKMNELTLAVEAECPVGKYFGVSSIGEGRVWIINHPEYKSSKFVWKIKGNLHSKSHVKKLASVDIEKMANIDAFIDKHLSEERLVQGWNWLIEMKHPLTEASTGIYLKWIFNDVIKEENDELIGSGLTQKDLGGALSKKARIWFFTKIKTNDGL